MQELTKYVGFCLLKTNYLIKMEEITTKMFVKISPFVKNFESKEINSCRTETACSTATQARLPNATNVTTIDQTIEKSIFKK